MMTEFTSPGPNPYEMPSSAAPSSLSSPRSIGIAFLVVAMVVGLPGNLLVVWTVAFRLRRRSITTLLVLQLALADSLVLLTAPFFLRQLSVGGKWEFGSSACRLLHFSCGVNMYASVYLITLMSADRLLGVSRPFVSQRFRTKSRFWPTIVVVWVLALVLAAPSAVYRATDQQNCSTSHPGPGHQMFQYTLETVAAFVLPFSLVAVSYCRIMRTLEEARRRWGRRQNAQRKRSRLIALIVASFVLLWAPYHIVNLLQMGTIMVGATEGKLLANCEKARSMLIALAFFSSSINPLLYAWAGSVFMGSFSLGCVTRLLEGTASEGNSRRGESCVDRVESVKMGQVPQQEEEAKQ